MATFTLPIIPSARLRLPFTGTKDDIIIPWSDVRRNLFGNNPNVSAFYTSKDGEDLVLRFSDTRISDDDGNLIEISYVTKKMLDASAQLFPIESNNLFII